MGGARLGVLIGLSRTGVRTGVNWVRVPTEKELSIYSHYQEEEEEECVNILSGRTIVEIGGEEFGIDAGTLWAYRPLRLPNICATRMLRIVLSTWRAG
jgi:uncharacterized cupin superfamily protein